LLVAGIVAALVSQRDAGYWRPLMQFALGDWPDVDALPQPVLFWGVVLNVLTAFGFPILLITFLYRRLTRSTTMQIGHYITRRDEFLKVQMYLILRERVPDLDADAWDIVEQAMEETQQTWDSVLPPETLNSLERDEVVVIEDQPRFARINR